MEDLNFFQIVNSEGLYSSGGMDPKWFKKPSQGKVWRSIGPLKNHLRQLKPVQVSGWRVFVYQAQLLGEGFNVEAFVNTPTIWDMKFKKRKVEAARLYRIKELKQELERLESNGS